MKYSISLTEVSATDPAAGWNWYVSLDGKTLAQGREIVRAAAETAADLAVTRLKAEGKLK